MVFWDVTMWFIKIMVFWDVTPCDLICRYQDYGVLGCDHVVYQDYGVLGCDTM
jgi:hypothetical protein